MKHSPFTTHHSPFAPVFIGACVAALAGLVYANALANGLVWDDPIVLDRQLRAFQTFHDLIFIPRNIPQFSPDYYRPLTTLTYLVDRAIGGSNPLMFHLSVVVFHVIAAVLVFRFGLALFAGTAQAELAAGIGAALFAVHPIHTESVAWGAGRSDVLACVFSVAAATAYLQRGWPPLRRAAVAAVCIFFAMLAKETATAMLVVVPASTLFLGWPAASIAAPSGRAERRRQRDVVPVQPRVVLLYAPFVVVFVVYAALRQATIGSMLGPSSPSAGDVPARLLAAVGLYVGKLFLPVHQSAFISDLPASQLGLLMSGVAVAAGLAAGVWTWFSNERRWTYLLLWTGLTLAPSLAIVWKIPPAPVAERYLYLPSVGFCLLFGAMATRALQVGGGVRIATGVVVATIVATGALATVRRNAVWRTNLTLWEDTAAKNTTDGMPMRSLATAHQQAGDAAKAAEYFQIALQRRNDHMGLFTINNNLGSLAMVAKRFDEAERHYQDALAVNPSAPECLYNLGLIALTRATEGDPTTKLQQAQRARRFFEQAAPLSPLDPDIEVGLGQTLSALGDNAGARIHFERALQLGLQPTTEASVRKLLSELQ